MVLLFRIDISADDELKAEGSNPVHLRYGLKTLSTALRVLVIQKKPLDDKGKKGVALIGVNRVILLR